jgi:hypothetical protein
LIDLLALFGLVLVAIASVLILMRFSADFDGIYFLLGFSTVFLSMIPFLLYLSDALGIGVTGISVGALGFAAFVSTLLLSIPRILRRELPQIRFDGFRGFMFVAVVDAALGLGPLAPSFYPTSLGDTAHHFSYVEYLFRYSALPHSSSDMYPLVHHGLYGSISWNYPQGMHLLIAILAKATGAPPIVLLGSVSVFAAILTSLVTYYIALLYGSRKSAVISAILTFVGAPLALSTQAGSLTTMWGILFVSLFCLFLVKFERKQSFLDSLLLGFSALGLSTYYPLYTPLALGGVILMTFHTANKRNAVHASFTTFGMSAIGVGLFTMLQTRTTAGPSIAPALSVRILSTLGKMYALAIANAAPLITLALIFTAVLILAKKFYLSHSKPKASLLATAMALMLVAVYPYLAVIFHKPGSIDCIVSCNYYYVPGYNFGLNFGLAILLGLASLAYSHTWKSTTIFEILTLNFSFLLLYYFTGNVYFSSKHVFIASAVAPILLGPVVGNLRKLVSGLKVTELRVTMPSSRNLSKILALILLGVITINISLQGFLVVNQQLALRPTVYGGEFEAGEWLRANADSVLPCRNYEYFVTMDVLRAEFFEVASERQFNLNKLPGGWSTPPYPLSYTFSTWLSFAKPGDILIADMSYPGAVPSTLRLDTIGRPVLVNRTYIEILHVSPPAVIIRYIGTASNAHSANYTCIAGWSFLQRPP